MTATRTPADHIALAKETLTGGADPKYAIAHALIAIAECFATNQVQEAYAAGVANGSEAVASTINTIFETIGHTQGGNQ